MLKLRLLLSTLIIGLSRPYETNGQTESGSGAVTSSSIFATATATWSTQLQLQSLHILHIACTYQSGGTSCFCSLLASLPGKPETSRNTPAAPSHGHLSQLTLLLLPKDFHLGVLYTSLATRREIRVSLGIRNNKNTKTVSFFKLR